MAEYLMPEDPERMSRYLFHYIEQARADARSDAESDADYLRRLREDD